jgi:glutamate-ammonia-ligase adenylyltransferase
MTDVSFFNPPLYEQDFEQELKFQLRPNISQDRFLNIMRRFCREQKFRIGVLVLRNYMTAEQASIGFTALARICIRYITAHIEEELRNKYHLPYAMNDKNSLCIVAMGSLGAGEMNSASDLDLTMIYDGDFSFDTTNPMPSPSIDALSYYAKLGKRILTALTVSTEEGALYDVDMRLRPSGNSGPLVIHFDRFKQYQTGEAHTWEKCALTRAEPICGSDNLQQKIKNILSTINASQENAVKIKTDIHEMRLKLLASRQPKNIWDIKLTKGGIFDISFIVQYLILTYELNDRKNFSRKTKENLGIFLENKIISQEDYRILTMIWDIYQELLHIFAIAKIDISETQNISKKIQKRLCDLLDIDDFQKAEQKLMEYNQSIIKLYQKILDVAY